MGKYIMSLDQGTTSCRCIVFNRKGEVISLAQKEFKQIYPKPGWVEHDAMEIWAIQAGVAQEAMRQVGAEYHDIAAIGITNQRETTVVWEKDTGRPVYNAIVWQCRRTAEYCDELKAKGLSDTVQRKTGLLIDAYFSATKLKWILDHVERGRERAKNGELLFGTIESWLIWNLTKGRVHVTDYSNAARTMLFNIKELKWDEELLELFDIPEAMLPEAVPSSYIYGETDPLIFGGPIPIASAAGDQQAALFGQACFQSGDAKNTYGTGGFLLMNTGKKPVYSKNGLLTTVAWGINDEVYYALEGSVFVAGAAVQWLRDELKIIEKSSDTEAMALSVPDTNGVYFVPAFVGLGAPYWDPYARGIITGLTRGVNRNHLVRATLEAIAYQTWDVLEAMQEDSGIRLAALKVDGGASENRFLMQFQADIIGTQVERSANKESTAVGAAYLAGLAVGFWSDLGDVVKNRSIDGVFEPSMDETRRMELLQGWHKAVSRCRE
ncbi:MAG: glycerol kinase GlpK [Clostridiales Family XIII bacterium]|jgi:glycerol kinase|nr:glycerol kinase GlpK [Clostridiales Family XIII bacterium]